MHFRTFAPHFPSLGWSCQLPHGNELQTTLLQITSNALRCLNEKDCGKMLKLNENIEESFRHPQKKQLHSRKADSKYNETPDDTTVSFLLKIFDSLNST